VDQRGINHPHFRNPIRGAKIGEFIAIAFLFRAQLAINYIRIYAAIAISHANWPFCPD
jgi:hypothetical protein